MKKNFIKKAAALGVIGILTLGQSFNAFAAVSYIYSADYDSDSNNSTGRVTRYLTGTMKGTSNYLGIEVHGVYTVRGSSRIVETNGASLNKSVVDSSVSAIAIYTGTIGDGRNYYAVRCAGSYKTSKNGSWYPVALQFVEF